ncbi:MAG: hypothetical protein AAGF89_01175 [Bacteroidota bacterium]
MLLLSNRPEGYGLVPKGDETTTKGDKHPYRPSVYAEGVSIVTWFFAFGWRLGLWEIICCYNTSILHIGGVLRPGEAGRKTPPM